MGAFNDKVYEIVAQIPRGKVASYGQIARLIGQPRKARFVGYAMRSNPHPGSNEGDIPCHRVVFKDGSLCESYVFGGAGVQRAILEEEGVLFADDTHVDMEQCAWDGREVSNLEGDVPMLPPEDFDWKAELGNSM